MFIQSRLAARSSDVAHFRSQLAAGSTASIIVFSKTKNTTANPMTSNVTPSDTEGGKQHVPSGILTSKTH